MRIIQFCIALLLMSNAVAATTIEGQVLDVEGKPVVGALLTTLDYQTGTNDGGYFTVAVDADAEVYRLRVSAPGYYDFLHTYSRADVRAFGSVNDTLVTAPIVLVRKQPGRRLLVFAGDTMMGRRFVNPRASEPALVRAGSEEADMQSVLQHVRPYFELADFASVNLETQLASEAPQERLPKSVTFYTHPAIADALHWAGVDYVALGNNHTFDYLDGGLNSTLTALRNANMAFSGAGEDDATARQPHRADLSGQSVNLLSYVGWAGTFKPNQIAEIDKGGAAFGTSSSIAEDLSTLSPEALNVVQLHSGLEYASKAPLFEETLLKLAVDNGADLAIGHHSHVLQGFEVYRGQLIAYSLGNFVFDQYIPETQSGMLVYAWYDDDKFYRAEIVPLHIDSYIPAPATGRFRYDILQRLARLSASAQTCTGRSGAHLMVRPCTTAETGSKTQDLVATSLSEVNTPVHLSELGAEPTLGIARVATTHAYRLGLDRLRRGDFEYANLFGRNDRSWMEHPQIGIAGENNAGMVIRLEPNEVVATGMKVFTRVFTRSNPATIAGRLEAEGCAVATISLQRRVDGAGFQESLLGGPVSVLGELRIDAGMKNFAIDFQLPRTSTRSIRLLMDFEACAGSDTATSVHVDDLVMVEWQTPWMTSGEEIESASTTQATHIQINPR